MTPACMGAEFLRECFDADYEEGTLRWRTRPIDHFQTEQICRRWNERYAGQMAGGPHKAGYMAVWVTRDGKRHALLVHRVLWCMRIGKWPTKTIDHKNMDRTCNKWSNLREATYTEQNANRPPMRSGLKGATFDRKTGRYVAQITRDGRNHFLGRFATELEAHQAYARAAKAMHAEFARVS